MSQDPVMMDELRCGECNYLLNPYAQECPKCGEKVDPLDQMRWFVRSAASTIIVLIWSLAIYFGAPIPPWTIIPVAVVALFMVVRERTLFKNALQARSKRLEDLARMSGQFPAMPSETSDKKTEKAAADDEKAAAADEKAAAADEKAAADDEKAAAGDDADDAE